MRFYKSLLLAVLVLGLMTVYNNCSGVGFTSGSALSVGVKGEPNPTVPEVIANCNQAAAAGTLKTVDQSIKFDDTKTESGRAQVCDFGIGDNLPIRDTFMQARYEQSRTLNLPPNAVLCDVQLQTDQQQFRYDDILFLTFNGVIMGSNNKTAILSNLNPESVAQLGDGQRVPLYKYDWSALGGAPFQSVLADDYCVGADQGAGNCSWPMTEMTGNIVFQFHPELLIAVALKASAEQQTFGFVTSGDDDLDSDCYHQELNFSAKIKYYLR